MRNSARSLGNAFSPGPGWKPNSHGIWPVKVDRSSTGATLGQLIAGMKAARLQENMLPALAMILKQRNYLSHNIYRLFAGSIEETILPRSQLLDSDIDCFTERAWQLADNLDVLADSITKKIRAATA
jgi:hypothetical protein